MGILINVLIILGIVVVAFFVITFLVYFFNIDMKVLAKLEPLFNKHYDKIKRDKHL